MVDWLTDCGNDCLGPAGHAEGCPVHCYCFDYLPAAADATAGADGQERR